MKWYIILLLCQVEEWEQFQNDLLTTVKVANDFKTEVQHDLQKLEQENLLLKERNKQLSIDLDKAKGECVLVWLLLGKE